MAGMAASVRSRYEPRDGDYFTDGRRLFQVVKVVDHRRAIVEDCASDMTGEHDLDVIRKMRLVRRSTEGMDGMA